jgi:hypothetical protein
MCGAAIRNRATGALGLAALFYRMQVTHPGEMLDHPSQHFLTYV